MNNQSQALTIEVLISLEWFTVQFETDSIERNRLMAVRYNGFLLDTAELPHTHPTYYKEIKKEMCKAAETYWNSLNEASEKPANKEITGIPTLDYQGVLNNQMNMITKALGLAILLLTSFSSFCQPILDFGMGAAKVISAAKDDNNIIPVGKISAGYQFDNNLVAEAVLQPSITRIVNAPCYLGAKAGYNFHGLVPSIGALYNYRNADDVSMNRWEMGCALKYQNEIGENGGLYVEAMYTRSSIQLTAGFHVVFQ